MENIQQENFESSAISIREIYCEKIKNLFQDKAIEGHLFGSLARGNSDAYSDIDIWFTFNDEDIEEVLAHRFEYYTQIGEVLHICEPPQNAPLRGVQTSVTYKTPAGYITVDCSLCPLSTAHSAVEAKTFWGPELPIKTMEYNPQKVQVNETYRLDFFIGFIFTSIKRILRKQDKPLEPLFQQYNYLSERYGVSVSPLDKVEHSFASLKQVIENVDNIATEKQRETLATISDFIKKMENHVS